MSRNLLKGSFTCVQENETRIIDTNELIAQKLKSLESIPRKRTGGGGFSEGLEGIFLDAAVLQDGEENLSDTGLSEENVQHAAYEGPDPEELIEEAKARIARMQEAARAELEQERQRVLDEARYRGYEEGQRQAEMANREQAALLEEKRATLEAGYQARIDSLEPEFIDTLTGIYEHIFKVDMHGHRDIIIHLMNSALRKIEGGREFLIRVSKEDYAYASMQKKQILSGVGTAGFAMEIIEDVTLRKNECLIETDSGIFDCSLGTQLEELSRMLKLLSYERIAKQE